MSSPRDPYRDPWAGLEPPEPARRSASLAWIVAGLAAVAALSLCAAAAFFLARTFLFAPEPTTNQALPEVPTFLVTASASAPANASPSSPGDLTATAVARPTVTLPAPSATAAPGATAVPSPPQTPPLGAGGNVLAVRLAQPPELDGLLLEWGGVPTAESAFPVFTIADWDGSDDLTAVWRLGWDENNLYIGVEVDDDLHVQTQTEVSAFRGDSLEMQLDTDLEGDFGPGLSADDYQLVISPGDFGGVAPSAARFQGADGQMPYVPGDNIVVVAQAAGEGYTLEAAIPWSELGAAPTAGMVIGLALNANDNDTPGTARQEMLKSHVSTRVWGDPTSWGTVTLLGS
ncbi:MAG: sugar-binding protein [Candidatus Promineifilaceae bacterium]